METFSLSNFFCFVQDWCFHKDFFNTNPIFSKVLSSKQKPWDFWIQNPFFKEKCMGIIFLSSKTFFNDCCFHKKFSTQTLFPFNLFNKSHEIFGYKPLSLKENPRESFSPNHLFSKIFFLQKLLFSKW